MYAEEVGMWETGIADDRGQELPKKCCTKNLCSYIITKENSHITYIGIQYYLYLIAVTTKVFQ